MTTVKKAATKTTTVKSSTKKVAQRDHKKAKRVLVCAEGRQCFWTTDGNIIANLIELSDTFNRMSEEVFNYHVNDMKNDFADWVEYVLGDSELAGKLRGARKPRSARTVVVARLKSYDV